MEKILVGLFIFMYLLNAYIMHVTKHNKLAKITIFIVYMIVIISLFNKLNLKFNIF
jgi:hypothetical protein